LSAARLTRVTRAAGFAARLVLGREPLIRHGELVPSGKSIERVYVIGNRHDLRYTGICVASIRRWYPQLPISLVKDESRGPYDTSEIEQAWKVDVFQGERRRFGWGWAKLVPLLEGPPGERCLILDSDVVFVGHVIRLLETSAADFVVQDRGEYDRLRPQSSFIEPQAMRRFDPDYVATGYSFNTGGLVATCGLLDDSDFEPFIEYGDVVVDKRSELFTLGADQGVLNYLLPKKAQLGEITLDRLPFMLWGAQLPRRIAYAPWLTASSPYPYVVHWAGKKRKLLLLQKNGRLLRHFEAAYYRRIRYGRLVRRLRAAQLAWSILTGKERLGTKGPRLDAY
jgi:hypothetical protein